MSRVKNIGLPIAPIFVHVKIPIFAFFDFLDLDRFLSSTLSPFPTTSLSLVLYSFRTKFNDAIIFNIEVSSTVVLLKL